MPYAYSDTDSGHIYTYVPPHAPGERLPVLLFLHGSFGNFKGYFYLWRRFADQHHWIVACPSFGFGNWYRSVGPPAIARALERTLAGTPADPERVVLAGLSNGGTGVVRAAASATPKAYAGLIFLSRGHGAGDYRRRAIRQWLGGAACGSYSMEK